MNIQTVGIIGAMQPEIELLKNSLANLQTHTFGAFEIYTGELAGKKIALSLSGIGKVNAAVAATLLIQNFTPDCVINTGSAGGLGAGLKVGDVVIGNEAAHHDVDVCVFGYAHGQVPQLPPRFAADEALSRAAAQAAAVFQAAFAQTQVRRGLIVSGDQFIASAKQTESIRSHFADVQAVEMEAAAIAQTCAQLGKPFAVIRAVSDNADGSASVSFDEFLPVAAEHSAQMVKQLIAAL